MALTTVLFCFYFLLAIGLLLINKNNYLTKWQLVIAFSVKVAFGCAFGYISLHYFKGATIDTWYYHTEGWKAYQLLLSNPWEFVTKDIFKHGYTENQWNTLFNSENSYLKDLPNNLMIKLVALTHLLTGGRYYVNVILYCAIIFKGSLWCYYLINRYAINSNWWYYLVFFFPPFLFWNSGIMKDGICFMGIMGCLYSFSNFIHHRRFLYLVQAFLFFQLVFFFRSYVGILLFCTCIYWLIINGGNYSKWMLTLLFSATMLFLFFASSWLPNGMNLPLKLAERQQAFIALNANSLLNANNINQSVGSYFNYLPKAIAHLLLTPRITQVTSLPLVAAYLEQALFIGMLLTALWFRVKRKATSQVPFFWAIAFFCIANYLVIGYTVPILGAIVRYRSSYYLLFICIFYQNILARINK